MEEFYFAGYVKNINNLPYNISFTLETMVQYTMIYY